jgi:alpha-glucoside transport system substrate-binding protein
MVADGWTPWCLGFESGEASGWPGTDWIENLLLAEAGPQVYDRWIAHELPFGSSEVRTAFERLGDILFTDGYVLGGARGGSNRFFAEAQLPMVEESPPGCWLHQFPTFATEFLPPASFPAGTDAFTFPWLADGVPRTEFEGGILANRMTGIEQYPAHWRDSASLVYESLANDTFRFDASDLMPPEIGEDLFWKAMMTYAAEGPDSLDRILSELDAAWPS